MPRQSFDLSSLMGIFVGKDKVYKDGVVKTAVKTAFLNAPVDANGLLTFNLVDTQGDAIFNDVFKESCRLWVDDSSGGHYFGNYTLSADKKVLTMTARQPGSVGLTILGITTTVLIPTVVKIPAGTIVNLAIRGT